MHTSEKTTEMCVVSRTRSLPYKALPRSGGWRGCQANREHSKSVPLCPAQVARRVRLRPCGPGICEGPRETGTIKKSRDLRVVPGPVASQKGIPRFGGGGGLSRRRAILV